MVEALPPPDPTSTDLSSEEPLGKLESKNKFPSTNQPHPTQRGWNTPAGTTTQHAPSAKHFPQHTGLGTSLPTFQNLYHATSVMHAPRMSKNVSIPFPQQITPAVSTHSQLDKLIPPQDKCAMALSVEIDATSLLHAPRMCKNVSFPFPTDYPNSV